MRPAQSERLSSPPSFLGLRLFGHCIVRLATYNVHLHTPLLTSSGCWWGGAVHPAHGKLGSRFLGVGCPTREWGNSSKLKSNPDKSWLLGGMPLTPLAWSRPLSSLPVAQGGSVGVTNRGPTQRLLPLWHPGYPAHALPVSSAFCLPQGGRSRVPEGLAVGREGQGRPGQDPANPHYSCILLLQGSWTRWRAPTSCLPYRGSPETSPALPAARLPHHRVNATARAVAVTLQSH